MKVSTPHKTVVGDKVYWYIRWHPPGQKPQRRFFDSQKAALQEKTSIEQQQKECGEAWMSLDARSRMELISLLHEAQENNTTLRQAFEFWKLKGGYEASTTIGTAWERFMKEKFNPAARLSDAAIKALKSNVGRFVEGREAVMLDAIKREQILEYLQRPEWGPYTFNTYLTSLGCFFNWCVKCDLMKKSPTFSLQKISKKQMPDIDTPPAVLTVDQCRSLLKAALKEDRRMLGYIVVGMFGGLRPEKEAGCLQRQDIGEKEILVRGANAKDGQRRHVEIHPTLAQWLKLRSEFPPDRIRTRFQKVRAAAGLIQLSKVEGKEKQQITWTGWAQDCLRHTFASNYLALYGAEKTIQQLGHGDYSMLFTHYRKLITREEAERFWALTPSEVDPEAFVSDKVENEVAGNGADAGVSKDVGGNSNAQVEEGSNPEADAHGATVSSLKEALPWVSEDRPVTEDLSQTTSG